MSARFVRRWERSAEAALAVEGDEAIATQRGLALVNLACEIDLLERQLVDDARTMAERFTRYAADVEAGMHASDPSGYSTLRDIPERAATLKAKRDALRMLLVATFGEVARERFSETACCGAELGTMRARVSMIFGIEEDERVLNGRARVY